MKNLKILRKALCFGDMDARYFLGDNKIVVVLQPKRNRIRGHIQWHINYEGSYLTLQADSSETSFFTQYDAALKGKFSTVQNTAMELHNSNTWRDNEVSAYDFLCNESVLKFIGEKSLAYRFNQVMENDFSSMLYKRPKTDPNLNFKPLTQYRSIFWIGRHDNEVTCIFDLSENCVAIWQLHGMTSNRIHFYNRYEFTKLQKTTNSSSDLLMKTVLSNSFMERGFDKRNIFKHLVNEDIIFPLIKSAADMRSNIYDIFNVQATLWFRLVTEIKSYRK